MMKNDIKHLNRRIDELQAIERRILAIEGLHKQLMAAFELFAFGPDNGRLGAIVTIRAVISYFSERSPILAAQGLLNPMKQVADALEELGAGLVSPILAKPRARRPTTKVPSNVLAFRGGVSAMVDALLHCPDPVMDVDTACAKVARKLQSFGYQIGRQDSSPTGVIALL